MGWSNSLFIIIFGLGFINEFCKDFFESWKLYRTTKKGLFKAALNFAGILFWIYVIVNSGMNHLFEDKFEQTDFINLIALGSLLVFSFTAIFVFPRLKSASEKNTPNQLLDQNPDLQKDQKPE